MDKQSPLKHIIHLDMDSFYPSVEVLDSPELKGKPVIVDGSKERGVVSSASYEARRFGVHSAQPMATAMRLWSTPHRWCLPLDNQWSNGRVEKWKIGFQNSSTPWHSITAIRRRTDLA